MFRHHITTLAVSATLLLIGAAVVRAADEPAATQSQKQTQTREQEQTRKQAIESVEQKLKENPRDEGLRHAGQCLASSEQCKDVRVLDQAMESVRRNMERHPEDKGLGHAMTHLERHHRRLEKQHMERERSMHRESPGRSERLERRDGSEGSHR